MQVAEYQDHIKELCDTSEAQGEAFQQLYVQHEEDLKVHSVRQLHFFSSFLISEKTASIQQAAFIHPRFHEPEIVSLTTVKTCTLM